MTQERPNIRHLELAPYAGNKHNPTDLSGEEESLFVLIDPEGFSPPLVIPMPVAVLITLMDGSRTLGEIQEEFKMLSNTDLPISDLYQLVQQLDGHLMLDNDHFRDYLSTEMRIFSELRIRPARMAGAAYPENPVELKAQMEKYMKIPEKIRHAEGSTQLSSFPVTAAIIPHIDPIRGGASYGWGYEALSTRNQSELFIIFGTSHNPMKEQFALTHKHYDTPLGTVKTDTAFLNKLEKLFTENLRLTEKFHHISDTEAHKMLYGDEFLHRDEHSVEFEALFLQYISCSSVENGAEREIRILPILVNSFIPFMENDEKPAEDPVIHAMLMTLKELILQEEKTSGKKVTLIAAADLSHIGPRFAGPEPISQKQQDRLRDDDTQLLSHLMNRDCDGFWNEILKVEDCNNVCGIAPIFCTVRLLQLLNGEKSPETQVELLSYEQTVDEESDSCVSFATLIFQG